MELALPQRPDGSSHAVGFSVVVAVHLVIGYAIVSGLAQKVVDSVREPLEARLIDEVRPPPPPPPPELPKPLPRQATPTPTPYVPPPEVSVAAPPNPAPTITATTPVPPPVQQDFKPAPSPAPAAPPHRPEPLAIGVACPTQVAPVLPRRATQEGITGQVRAQVSIRSGKVVDVQILSSKPRGLFDDAVRTAMLKYGCQTTGTDEIVAVQTFDFRAD